MTRYEDPCATRLTPEPLGVWAHAAVPMDGTHSAADGSRHQLDPAGSEKRSDGAGLCRGSAWRTYLAHSPSMRATAW